jgi:hypothetical protein
MRRSLIANLASLVAPATAMLLASTSAALAQSCAMCAASFGPDDPIQRAFSWSILFMIAAPYTIAGTIAAWFWFTYRRAPGRGRARVIDLAPLRSAPAGSGGDAP